MIGLLIIMVLVLLGVSVSLSLKLYKGRKELEATKEEYRPFIDDVGRRDALLSEVEQLKQKRSEQNVHVEQLNAQVMRLNKEVSLLDEEAHIQSFAFYKPRYGFPDGGKYEHRLKVVREQQKQMLKEGTAAVCHADWQVGGSAAAGRKMMQGNIKLMLMAFHGECDACISKVKYNNVSVMEKRIERCFDSINKLMGGTQYEITSKYYNLKLSELYLVHEFHELKQQEREEQQRIKDEMREEAQNQREAERVMRESEREEARYSKALEQANQALAKASGEKQAELLARIEELNQQLQEAQAQSVRAKSMAETTRVGYVYVISNIGSFGDGVYKVGMTRRLEPMDRVKELGDASVPFSFDVHAMIASQDAPALENALHKALDLHRVNRVNRRKEFFRVPIQEIEKLVMAHEPHAEFTYLAEAEEYRKSTSLDVSVEEAPAAYA